MPNFSASLTQLCSTFFLFHVSLLFKNYSYTEIEEGNQTPQKPLPPLPPAAEKARARPPAPPPSRYGSTPRPLPHPAPQPLPQREGQRESSPRTFPKPKPPASLPRPVPVLPETASLGGIPARREIRRSISEKNLAGKPGYDNVVQQFKGSALSFIHEGKIVIPGVDLYFADVGLAISLVFCYFFFLARRQCGRLVRSGRLVRALDLKSGDPEFRSYPEHQVAPGTIPRLRVYIANRSTFYQL